MKFILTVIFSFIFVFLGFSQTRNVVVDSNGVVVQPTNIWTANAANARNGIGLGSAATNPASAFQPSSTILSNLASSNAGSLTNITASSVVGTVATATNVTGVVAISNGGSGASNAQTARTNFGLVWSGLTNSDAAGFRSALALGTAATNPASAFQAATSALTNLSSSNGGILTNIRATNLVGIIPASNIATVNFSNVAGTLSIDSGGTGATNAEDARTNLGLNSAATNPASAFQPASSVLTNLASNNAASLTNIAISNIVNLQSNLDTKLATNGNGSGLTSITAANITGTIAITNGGSGTTTAGGARTNFGLGWTGLTNTNANGFRSALELSATWLTNTNATNFRAAIGIGETNNVNIGGNGGSITTDDLYALNVQVENAILFTNPALTRTNLGLGWSALTNSNAGTGLVSVNTNGDVVSPTNFWQAAPIKTLVQSIIPVNTNVSTNTATNARNLYVYSLATNVVNTTNIITLPTNTSTFAGDVATIIHSGTTSSLTVVRQIGSTNNLIAINRFDESVKFIYENSSWVPYHNISFQEPIYFSGTNVSNNAAISRTNLGLGATNNVVFSIINADSIREISDQSYIEFDAEFLRLYADSTISFESPVGIISFDGASTAATTRTNLGLGLPALTNTNNAKFQEAIFTTNVAPTNATTFGDHVAWMGVSIVTNGVTNVFKIPLYK